MTNPSREVRFVRKRDGSAEPFDKRRIADAIYKAAKAAQVFDRLLADALAEVVALYLVKDLDVEVPDVELIQNVVERVLMQAGHAEIARAYILYRAERARAREAFAPGGTEAMNAVFVNMRGKKLVWHPERIAAKLTERTKLPRSFWEEIVKVVEGIVLE